MQCAECGGKGWTIFTPDYGTSHKSQCNGCHGTGKDPSSLFRPKQGTEIPCKVCNGGGYGTNWSCPACQGTGKWLVDK